ncbi:MAG: GUN4 domain-containing protein, partial [Cylindrospermopsis raciborskii]|uniref:GUN4 domain-containing protein n=1 Tax=Cylindrospermopsis raciborskii TaxID=77022 RepID=UPI003D10F50E
TEGKVIGIHGLADTDSLESDNTNQSETRNNLRPNPSTIRKLINPQTESGGSFQIKTGFNAGIPINILYGVLPQNYFNARSITPPSPSISRLSIPKKITTEITSEPLNNPSPTKIDTDSTGGMQVTGGIGQNQLSQENDARTQKGQQLLARLESYNKLRQTTLKEYPNSKEQSPIRQSVPVNNRDMEGVVFGRLVVDPDGKVLDIKFQDQSLSPQLQSQTRVFFNANPPKGEQNISSYPFQLSFGLVNNTSENSPKTSSNGENLSPTYNPNPSESNPINVDRRYAKLETLLKAQDFRAADRETSKVMLAVANRESEGYLETEDAEKFPCKELRSIDQLWLKYSRGKFGISVQQQIYQSLGGTKEYNYDVWKSMGERVGWWKGGNLLTYNELNFSQTAPSGQLPFKLHLGGARWDGGWGMGLGGWWDSSLLSRHAECNT